MMISSLRLLIMNLKLCLFALSYNVMRLIYSQPNIFNVQTLQQFLEKWTQEAEVSKNKLSNKNIYTCHATNLYFSVPTSNINLNCSIVQIFHVIDII